MIEAIVFDMDGLLVDSEPLWHRARVEAIGAERLNWTDEDQQRIMGTSTQEWAGYVAARAGDGFTTEQVIEVVISQMEAYYHAHVPALPGAQKVLEQLSERYPLGLASGSPYRLINAVLQGAGWAELFTYVLSSDDMALGKPAPDIYTTIAERMAVQPGHIAIFEDSPNGIIAGHAAGCKVIAVPGDHRPSNDVLAKAERVITSLQDFRMEMLADL